MCPMRVKNSSRDLAGENGATHRFPVGMHVLAVDDDKTCLEILEKMLRKCQYQVTTESRAVEALRMLRENRNKYDLVISDVKMPDIGGMELLKVVGLEMDLPVIMLSAYGDTELVMEGITHGACDYLLKPVRIQELKNIWQHVIRRRKIEPPSHSPDPLGAKDGGLGPSSSGNDYQSENSNRKRKDHIQEDEEEDGEEDGPEDDDDDDSSRQKKPRVVWSMELHQKFVVAVSQLGLDKAVPKKILDLMNVERLTRENVASHLQKFRIYLKKMQDKRVVLGGKSSSYLPTMSALDGFRDFNSSVGSGRFLNPSLSSYPQGGRLNSLPGLGLRPSGLIQPQNLSTSLSNLQSAILPSNQSPNLFQGFPSSLDYKEFSSINDPTSSVGCSSKSIVNAPSNPLMTLRHQSCIEFGASNGSWQSGVQLGSFSSNSLPSSEPFDQSQVLLPNSFLNTFSPTTAHISSNPMEMSSTSQGGLIGNVAQKWEDHGMGYMNNTLHSLQNNFVNGTETYTSPIAQSHSAPGMGLRSGEEFLLDQTKPQDWGIESLDDLINTVDKREQRATTLLDA